MQWGANRRDPRPRENDSTLRKDDVFMALIPGVENGARTLPAG